MISYNYVWTVKVIWFISTAKLNTFMIVKKWNFFAYIKMQAF